MSKYFQDAEFRRCVPSCSIDQMQPGFLELLDAVREAAGIPLVLNSAYRSVEWEKSKKRTGSSSHTKGLAVDIRCTANATRYKIITAALSCGIRRIGVAHTYIHLDADESKSQGIIWDYYA